MNVVGELGVSARRAYRVLGQHRSTQRKVPKTPDDGGDVPASVWRELEDFEAYCDSHNIDMYMTFAPIMEAGPVKDKRQQIDRAMR